jgi:flavin reductase (DIM6/NTAB) family NADH-FMN oxidoreductase RutF
LYTREFVLNIVSEDFADKMNECSATVAPEVDEFELSGLTPIPSELVKPDRVAESRVQMECRLVQVVTVRDKPNGGNWVLGEVLRFHPSKTSPVKELAEQQEQLASSAEDAARLSETRYRGGATSYLEVLTNETNYFDSELGLAQARLNEILGLVSIYRNLGGGWQEQ